jgi:chromosome partitioning protein
MIIVVGGIKGGSGKTTIATNLAIMRAVDYKVLLVDADEQRSAWDWSQQRDRTEGVDLDFSLVTVCMSGRTIYKNLIKLEDGYDDIIVDTGGRDTTSQRSALSIADVLILPFKPSSIDIWTISSLRSILAECVNKNLKTYAVISQADPSGKDNSDAIEILKEFKEIQTLDFTIGNRKVFRNAASYGKGIFEMPLLDKKACQEMHALYDIIYQ